MLGSLVQIQILACHFWCTINPPGCDGYLHSRESKQPGMVLATSLSNRYQPDGPLPLLTVNTYGVKINKTKANLCGIFSVCLRAWPPVPPGSASGRYSPGGTLWPGRNFDFLWPANYVNKILSSTITCSVTVCFILLGCNRTTELDMFSLYCNLGNK